MANFLSKILPAKLFSKKGNSVLGIDISSSSIKLVQLRKQRGKAVLETYGELSLGPYTGIGEGSATNLPADKIGQALKDLIIEAKVTTKNAGASLPLSASLISVLALPNVSEKEIENIVPIEMRKYLPVSIAEVALDWWVIPEENSVIKREESNKIEVLTVAVHKDTILKYQKILSQANLDPTFFEVEIFSSMRAILSPSLNPMMIVDIGSANSKIYIVERGIVRDSHIINRGAQDITRSISTSLGVSLPRAESIKRGAYSSEDEKGKVLEVASLILEDIFSEANLALLNYEKKYNKTAEKTILTGGGAMMFGVKENAEKVFDMNVEIAHPFGKTETPAFLSDILKNAGPEFAVAIGLALRKLEEVD